MSDLEIDKRSDNEKEVQKVNSAALREKRRNKFCFYFFGKYL